MRLSYQEVLSIPVCLVSSLRGQKLKVELKASVGVHHRTALRHQDIISVKRVFQAFNLSKYFIILKSYQYSSVTSVQIS